MLQLTTKQLQPKHNLKARDNTNTIRYSPQASPEKINQSPEQIGKTRVVLVEWEEAMCFGHRKCLPFKGIQMETLIPIGWKNKKRNRKRLHIHLLRWKGLLFPMSADKDYKIQIHYVSRLSAYGPLKLLSYLSLCSLGLYLAKAFNHDMFQLCKRLQNAVI